MKEKLIFDLKTRQSYRKYRAMVNLFQRTEREWSENIYNTPLKKYNDWFSEVLEGRRLEDLIEGLESPVVIDLMSSPHALHDILPEGKGMGISVSLGDLRNKTQIDKDNLSNITHIAGKIEDSSTWHEIQRKLNSKKVNLVMEFAQGGLESIPIDPIFFISTLRNIWRLLDTDGYAVLQVPSKYQMEGNGVYLPHIVDILNQNGVFTRYTSGPYWSMLFQKPKNPSYNIPLLEK